MTHPDHDAPSDRDADKDTDKRIAADPRKRAIEELKEAARNLGRAANVVMDNGAKDD